MNLLSKDTVVLRRWGSSCKNFAFINGVDNVIGHSTEILKADVSSVSLSSELLLYRLVQLKEDFGMGNDETLESSTPSIINLS